MRELSPRMGLTKEGDRMLRKVLRLFVDSISVENWRFPYPDKTSNWRPHSTKG